MTVSLASDKQKFICRERWSVRRKEISNRRLALLIIYAVPSTRPAAKRSARFDQSARPRPTASVTHSRQRDERYPAGQHISAEAWAASIGARTWPRDTLSTTTDIHVARRPSCGGTVETSNHCRSTCRCCRLRRRPLVVRDCKIGTPASHPSRCCRSVWSGSCAAPPGSAEAAVAWEPRTAISPCAHEAAVNGAASAAAHGSGGGKP